MTPIADLRRRVLQASGATTAEAEELLVHTTPAVTFSSALAFPLPDEPFVAAWVEYVSAAKSRGVLDVLRECLVQLRFPIATGMSGDEAYRRATRRGELRPDDHASGVSIERPDLLRLSLHQAPAGRIPVIAPGTRADFVTLLQAIVHQNEPVVIPASCGAYMIAGYNNWSRVASLRHTWLAEGGASDDATGWSARFRELKPRKDLYQDRFILLSPGPYSGVRATDVGVADEEWLRLSFTIRLEHECAHYFTRRVLGSMRDSLLDELLADYAGIVAACGRFRADWFLRFLGLEAFPAYRDGGRMQNYRGTPPLSAGAFVVLQRVVHAAALNLEQFDGTLPSVRDDALRAGVLSVLAQMTLEELASAGGARLLGVRLCGSVAVEQASVLATAPASVGGDGGNP